MKHYDYVVLGAGSAGCVLAARLSEDPAARVLLVEAGGRDVNPLMQVPLLTGKLYRSRIDNWFYDTEPEAELGGRRIFQPRGKVLGGTSSINGMVYIRGQREDYDDWESLGLKGWGYRDVLPDFRRSEASERGESEYHGAAGPLTVTRGRSTNPLFEAWIEAGQQAGLPFNDDFNGATQEGVGRYDFTIRDGRRCSTAKAFLHPAMKRSNLDVWTKTQVVRLICDGATVREVELARGGVPERVGVAKEVVLAAGAFGSPAILLRSGIGPADDLSALGISVEIDSPEVGRNLQDHLVASVQFASKKDVTLHGLLRVDRAVLAVGQALLFGTGPGSVFPLEGAAFFSADGVGRRPEFQCHFLAGLASGRLRWIGRGGRDALDRHGFSANICQLRPESRGRLRLRSTDPGAPPLIEMNYFTAPSDMSALRKGVRRLRDIFAQKAFDAYRAEEIAPGDMNDADCEAWLRRSAVSVFHPVGTCRMGADAASVVDESLRVRGLDNARVADASVMPRIVSGNTNAPAIMIAEKAARMMKGAA